MKNNLIFLLLLSLIMFSSCEDFLEENPKSLIAFTNFDEDILESATIGLYEPLTRSRGRLWESHYMAHLTALGEYTHSRLSKVNTQLCEYDFENKHSWSDNAWPSFYEAIGRANILLKQVEGNKDIPEEKINQAVAEARFVRGTCYYHLVRGWGKVPLRLEPVTDVQSSGLALAETDDIYSQIISDIEFAISNLPDKTSSTGRATSGAAKTELADIYLTLHRYSDARMLVKEIMDNKNTYGYDLITSLETLFSPTSPTNMEDIFSIKFSQIKGLGSFLPTYFAPRSNSSGMAARGLEVLGVTDSAALVKNWDDKDLRKNLNLLNYYVDNGDTTDVVLSKPCKFVFGKYRDPGAPEETAGGNDVYLYRYADVLLIFAETENQINGPTADAYEAVNMIRRRAYGVPIDSPNAEVDLPSGLSQSEFDDLVLRERGYEFMAEGKRWYDLVRTGKWQTIIPEAGKKLPTLLYWPLPPKEIIYNDELE